MDMDKLKREAMEVYWDSVRLAGKALDAIDANAQLCKKAGLTPEDVAEYGEEYMRRVRAKEILAELDHMRN